MKLAITADVHINSEKPERLENFTHILQSIEKSGITRLIVAGDLCDDESDAPILLDACLKEHPGVEVLAIPGNHDYFLANRLFSAPNIKVFEKPQVSKIGGRSFLFLPYSDGETMGGIIEKSGLQADLEPDGWILVSHGDYGRINREASGHELGYFPLAGNDIDLFRPKKVILGHIHLPGPVSETVVYTGSPWPLDINETGQRRILVLDTGTGHLEPLPLTGTTVYARINCVIIPDGEEQQQLEQQIARAIKKEKALYSGKNFFEKLVVRVKCRGYSTSRDKIESQVSDVLQSHGINHEQVDKIDIDELRVADSEEHLVLAARVTEYIQSLNMSGRDTETIEALRPEITARAYRILFGS